MKWRVLLFISVAAFSGVAHAGIFRKQSCDDILAHILEEHQFQRNRGFDRYQEAFGHYLVRDLLALGPTARVLNGGAGEAVFEEEFLAGRYGNHEFWRERGTRLPGLAGEVAQQFKPDFTTVTYKSNRPAGYDRSGKLRHLSGKKFQDVDTDDLLLGREGFRYYYDLWGIASYDYPDRLLRRLFFEIGADDITIKILLKLTANQDYGSRSKVMLKDGRVVSLTVWYLSNPTIKVSSTVVGHLGEYKGIPAQISEFIDIRRIPGVTPLIPHLKRIGIYERVGVPILSLRGDTDTEWVLRTDVAITSEAIPKKFVNYDGPPPMIFQEID